MRAAITLLGLLLSCALCVSYAIKPTKTEIPAAVLEDMEVGDDAPKESMEDMEVGDDAPKESMEDMEVGDDAPKESMKNGVYTRRGVEESTADGVHTRRSACGGTAPCTMPMLTTPGPVQVTDSCSVSDCPSPCCPESALFRSIGGPLANGD
jgi:hypothetical protein